MRTPEGYVEQGCGYVDGFGYHCIRGWMSGVIPPEVARYKSPCPSCGVDTLDQKE